MKPATRRFSPPLLKALSPWLMLAACCPVVTVATAAGQAKAPLRFVQKAEENPTPEQQAGKRFQTALALALGKQMGRQSTPVILPRKRMIGALETGDADIMCSYIPAWANGAVDWSRPFIPTAEVLVSSSSVPAPRKLSDLKGKRIGTVLGFHYPELEQALGPDFVRDDAPSAKLSMKKWRAGRFDYFISTRILIDREQAGGELPKDYHLLVIKENMAMCAVARQGNVSLAEVNAAIAAIDKSGELARLLKLR